MSRKTRGDFRKLNSDKRNLNNRRRESSAGSCESDESYDMVEWQNVFWQIIIRFLA